MSVSVPNTNTFSLQDVYDAVNDHASPTADLLDCFAKANSSFFDPAYNQASYAPAGSMLRFRNYTPGAGQTPVNPLYHAQSFIPSDCSQYTFPIYPQWLQTSNLVSYYLSDLGISGADIEEIKIIGLTKDTDFSFTYNSSEIQVGDTINYSSGDVKVGRLISGTNTIQGSIYFTIKVSGYEHSEPVEFHYTINGCP
jgi:hypothetical protein